MRILIAEDDSVSRRSLEAQLCKWGYDVIVTRDGNEAWQVLSSADAPQLAILDWKMPGMDGIELCRRVREGEKEPYTYIILLTIMVGEKNLVTGMESGADDYITKPFIADELRVRLRAGRRIVDLQNELIRDIAERKRIEKEREQFLIFFETSSDLMCIADPYGAFLRTNPAFTENLGYSETELVARPFIELVHPDDKQETIDEAARQPETGCSLDFENRYRCKDGSFRWLSWRAVYNKYENRTYASARDITNRKNAEAYGEMSREILQILNETTDWQDSVQKVVATLKARTGFDAVGIRLQNGEDFPFFAQNGFTEDFLLKENSLIEQTGNPGVCRAKDGKVRLECTCGLIISGGGAPTNPLFTPGGSFWTNDSVKLLDIPPGEDLRLRPRKECVQQGYASMALVPIRSKDSMVGLIQFHDRSKGRFTIEIVELLERIALHVGAALMRKLAEEEKFQLEQQLQQAQKMESVGCLAGGVAHDFNNMLCAIIGHANIALMDLNPGQPLYTHLEEILKAGERSADLTRQLLTFARKQTVAPKVLNLNKTVADMLKMLQRIIGEDINLKWKSEPSLWSVKVDPSQIDQILANLCVNARDSITDIGEITIETRNSLVDEGYCAHNVGWVPGEYVRLSVSDNGCGMDQETQEHIFEPFFTTKDIGLGTGLGLSTVYGAVKQNGGFINVYSEPCLGTTITIYLPRHEGQVEQTGTGVPVDLLLRGQETILLVEDEPAILEIIKMILTMQGYTVLAANSPGEAIRLGNEHAGEVSLLMTDVIMPEMNGRDLAENLLTLYPNIKRLFMSGYTADVISHHGVLDKGLYFIQKPFSMTDLAAKVRAVLDSK